MKKITCRISAIILMATVLIITPITMLAQFSGGNGIENDPYIITTQTELAQLATYVNASTEPYANANIYYKLGNNLVLSGNWTPIGNTTDHPFRGVFDGDNKTISNFNISSGAYLGMFGIVGNTGMVKKFGILNVNINSSYTSNLRTGGVVGYNQGNVSNCYVTGIVNNTQASPSTSMAASGYVGGIVGLNQGSVSNCYSLCTVTVTTLTSSNSGSYTATSYAGGTVGYNQGIGSSVSNCYATGAVTASASCTTTYYATAYTISYAGGVVGNNSGNVLNCYSTGAVNATSICTLNAGTSQAYSDAYAGGVVGNNYGNVSKCYSISMVSSSSTASTYTTSTICYPYSFVGGIVGCNNVGGSSISNCAGLNPRLNCTSTNSGGGGTTYRYSGRITAANGGTLTNNIAFNNMINFDGSISWYYIGSSDFDGEDYTKNAINADGTLGGRFTNTNGWTIENGSLPGLFGSVVTMPQHLQLPNYPIITTENLPNGITNITYNQTLIATGIIPITWTIESGSLPTGLTLSQAGVISGTPIVAGTSNFTVKATNNVGNDTKALSITVLAPPVITTTTLPNGVTGTTYSKQLTATGTTPITWMLASGNLPTGLTLSQAGVISGTPIVAGTSNFTVKATNNVGNDTKALSITVLAPPVITTTTLPNSVTGTTYSKQLTATGTTPITWMLASGSLPAGLTLSPEGLISGTPTVANIFNFTVKATNSAGNDTKALSITITNSAVAPIITTTTLPNGTTGTAYNQQLAATGTAPITWTVESGSLPTGLTLSEAGIISGTPTVANTFCFTVKVSNSAGNDTKALCIVIDGVGIEELTMNNEQLTIYPNPTNGELRVQSPKFKVQSVEVFDVYGRMLSSNHLINTSSNYLINISDLPTGVYFVKISTEMGEVVKKVIKML